MKERVTTLSGTTNVILVAPHGHYLDDSHTGALTLAAAEELDAYAITNNGWKRSVNVDEIKGEANCNNIDHCQVGVVEAEFYQPVIDAVETLCYSLDDQSKIPLVLMIHGVGNSVRVKSQDPNLDLIVGFGAGVKPRLTSEQWVTDLFIDSAEGLAKWKTYEGAPGGDYSAYSMKNLTQALHHKYGGLINVLQLEFVYAIRKDDDMAKATGKKLADVIKTITNYTSYSRPKNIGNPPKI